MNLVKAVVASKPKPTDAKSVQPVAHVPKGMWATFFILCQLTGSSTLIMWGAAFQSRTPNLVIIIEIKMVHHVNSHDHDRCRHQQLNAFVGLPTGWNQHCAANFCTGKRDWKSHRSKGPLGV